MQQRVEVPGTFTVTLDDTGRVRRMEFSPLASYAGYFGVAAAVVSGDDDLDVESTDGPFWRAMQRALADGDPEIEWTE